MHRSDGAGCSCAGRCMCKNVWQLTSTLCDTRLWESGLVLPVVVKGALDAE